MASESLTVRGGSARPSLSGVVGPTGCNGFLTARTNIMSTGSATRQGFTPGFRSDSPRKCKFSLRIVAF
jgi:hypothetical protein